MGIYVVGCVLGCAGFAIRAVAARSGELQNLPYLIVSYVFIFSGPPIFAAGLYFIFARICYYVPAAAPITPYRIVRTFVSLDAICELLVGAGTGQFVNASNPKAQEIGQNILRAAIILQMILFLSFAYFAIRLQLNAKRLGIHGKWKMSLYTLYERHACRPLAPAKDYHLPRRRRRHRAGGPGIPRQPSHLEEVERSV